MRYVLMRDRIVYLICGLAVACLLSLIVGIVYFNAPERFSPYYDACTGLYPGDYNEFWRECTKHMEAHPETTGQELLDYHDELRAAEEEARAQEREDFLTLPVVP